MINFFCNGVPINMNFFMSSLWSIGGIFSIIVFFIIICTIVFFSIFSTIYTLYWLYKMLQVKSISYLKDEFGQICILYIGMIIFTVIFIGLQMIPNIGFIFSFFIFLFGMQVKKLYKKMINDKIE